MSRVVSGSTSGGRTSSGESATRGHSDNVFGISKPRFSLFPHLLSDFSFHNAVPLNTTA